MIKNKLMHTHIPMGRCDVFVYAGREGSRAIVYRQQIQFDLDFLSKGIRGLISSGDLLAYKENTIKEYVSDVHLTIETSELIKPEMFIMFNSYIDEESEISSDDVYSELSQVETETEENILREKIKKYFGE